MPWVASAGAVACSVLCGLRANAFRIPLMIRYPEPTPIATANTIVRKRTSAVTR